MQRDSKHFTVGGEKKKRKKEVRDLQNFKRMRKNLAGDYLLGKILEK